MQTRPFGQRGAVVVVPEMLLHLIPAYLDAMRAGSLQQQGLSLHPGLQIHFEPVIERDGASRRRRFGGLVVQGVAWMRGSGEGITRQRARARAGRLLRRRLLDAALFVNCIGLIIHRLLFPLLLALETALQGI